MDKLKQKKKEVFELAVTFELIGCRKNCGNTIISPNKTICLSCGSSLKINN